MKATTKLLIGLVTFVATACSQPTDMLTVINPDGSCYREFAENTDDEFLKGDKSDNHNPFPVVIDSTWKISWVFRNSGLRTDFPISKTVLDSIHKITGNSAIVKGKTSKENIIVFARRDYKSVEEMDNMFRFRKSNDWSKVKVKHELDKNFRWFYTYFTYRETYSKINTGLELPIENYITKDEAQFWFTGKPNILQGMNGLEIRQYVGDIEDKYKKWITENLWNAEFKALLDNYDILSKKPVAKEQLQMLEDSIYKSEINNLENFDMEKAMNSFFKTNAFTKLWENENSPMKKYEKNLDEKFTFLFPRDFNNKWILPGKIIESDGAVIHGDTIVWKLSTNRLIPADYSIEAQSRKANVWAFILTGILIITAIGSFLWKGKK